MTTSDNNAPVRWDPRTDRKAYVVWMAVMMAAIVLGFGLDFARYLGERPAPPLIMHLHGAVYTAWLLLVVAQIFLVEKGDIKLHKSLGWWTVGVAAVMAPLGVVAALTDEARRLTAPDSDPQFLGLEFWDMIAFAALTTAGALYRRDPATHKRLMILTVVSISDAGFSRLLAIVFKFSPSGYFSWWFQYFHGAALMLIAMVGWDLWRRRRVHPSVLAGGAFLLAGEAASDWLQFSPGWKALMTAAVKAWGYTG